MELKVYDLDIHLSSILEIRGYKSQATDDNHNKYLQHKAMYTYTDQQHKTLNAIQRTSLAFQFQINYHDYYGYCDFDIYCRQSSDDSETNYTTWILRDIKVGEDSWKKLNAL